ncbi:MAG: permease [Acidimicrobiales bacterium]
MRVLDAIAHALRVTGTMTWQILWALIFGFVIAATIESLVSKRGVARVLGSSRPRALVAASLFGIASSSCSYAAVAIARSLFRRGADFISSMAFEIASTNLVVELGVVLAVLIGWQFTLAEFVAGPIMIAVMAVAFRLVLRRGDLASARRQADLAIRGSMEGHAAMDMSIDASGGLLRRLRAPGALTMVSHNFVMEWAAVIRDIALGLLAAGAVGAWVPGGFWRSLFVTNNPAVSKAIGPLLGPVVSALSFVCSVGNVPLAAVLWRGGISFGGVVSFIFADLIIIPIVLIYRKYYGTRVALKVVGVFYVAMVVAGYIIELVFAALGLVPSRASAHIVNISPSWNYTSALDIAAAVLAVGMCAIFVRSGALPMIHQMGGAPPVSESANESDSSPDIQPLSTTGESTFNRKG